MRFLLKSTTTASRAAASAARDANKLLSKNNAHNAITERATNNITGKAWGQHCSPDCGCVLRFELQLSNDRVSPALSTTETVAAATYHAKRVMVTKAKHSSDNDENRTSSSSSPSSTNLKPLLTSELSSKSQRPILTSCTCTTLHELAQQVVNHLPGRTLQQLRNDTELGVVGARSSMAFRHTVLRENVLPALAEKEAQSWKKFGEMSSKEQQQQNEDAKNSSGGGIHEMNSTQQHGHCFDLVEDSFLSMIHERAMPPRKDDKVHAFSPTMGGYFRMYSPSGRQQKQRHLPSQHSLDEDDIAAEYATMRRNDSLASQSGDWLQKSPSSYFLFGDESSNCKSSYSDGILSLFIDYAKESIFGRNGNATAATSATVENGARPSNYLQLLDMYGDTHSDHGEKEEEPYDNWLDYVDTQSQGQS
mmetsp:Transcript_11942/g.24056  ORF Transcript_11942/g.24056 Transcript_11942/m.24056 type:complete len:420 (-) Transcript_11942:104-1363(-)